jgi:DNA polymerase-3 subunit delta'
MLALRPLAAGDVARALSGLRAEAADNTDIRSAAEAAEGSVGRALMFLESDAMELRRQVVTQLELLPQLDWRALHALGDRLAGTEAETLAAFMDAVNGWLSERLKLGPIESGRMVRVAEAWDKINQAGRDTEEYNLDRKPFVLQVFGALAGAAR